MTQHIADRFQAPLLSYLAQPFCTAPAEFQKAIAFSSTEAEFVSASDAGKHARLYLRSILTDLGFTQSDPTTLLIDNTGMVFMVDAQAPTRRTRHVDIRYFDLLQWSNTGQVKAKSIPTVSNISDSMTKPTGRIKFHQHAENPMPSTVATSSAGASHSFCSIHSDLHCIFL